MVHKIRTRGGSLKMITVLHIGHPAKVYHVSGHFFFTLALFDALLILYGRVVVVVAAGLAEGRTMPESRAGGRSD